MNIGLHRTRGPHAGLVALVAAALTVASVALPPLLTGQAGYVDPSASATDALTRARTIAPGLILSGFLLAGTAIPLAVCAATWSAGLRRRGFTVPGPVIALAGGVGAACALLVSGMVQWTAGQTADALDAGTASALTHLAYAVGGVGYAMPLGLLLAGVAVPGLLGRALPAALAWGGLLLAVVAELSWLSLLVPAVAYVLPAVRFGGLIWLTIAGFALRPQPTPAAASAPRPALA